MDHLFIILVFGHVVGDFFLQHKLMANNKNVPGWHGAGWCTIHVVVYTLTIALFAGTFSPLFLLGVAVPHWIADRWSLAYQWMKVTGGSDLLPHEDPTKAAFGVSIYIVLDQTYHLGSLYLLLMFMQAQGVL